MDYKKITIGKGTKKQRKVPSTYIPESLSEKDKKKQEKSILEKKKRPKLESFESKRSPHVIKFEKMYGFKITEKSKIYKSLMSKTGVDKVLEKGRAAYFSGGSRPNQTQASWSNARLASVLTLGPAARIDKNELLKYAKGQLLKDAKAKFSEKSKDKK